MIPGAFRIDSLQDEMTGVSLAGTQLRVNEYAMHDHEWNDIKVLTNDIVNHPVYPCCARNFKLSLIVSPDLSAKEGERPISIRSSFLDQRVIINIPYSLLFSIDR